MLNLKITTPERVLYNDQVDQVSLPTEQGEITVLPHHIPLVSNLKPGEILIKKNQQEFPFFCEGGFAQIKSNNQLIVLADAGQSIEELDEEKIKQSQERAKKALEQKKDKSEIAFVNAQSALERELARLRVARKWRSRARKGFAPEEVSESQKDKNI